MGTTGTTGIMRYHSLEVKFFCDELMSLKIGSLKHPLKKENEEQKSQNINP
jgi:hypothetical protein